jgi:peroxiredoxin
MVNKLNLLAFFLVTFMAATGAIAKDASSPFLGNESAINQYAGKGKWLVVMIWASDCTVCNREAHNYVDFHKLHKDKDAQMLGLSIDGKEKTKEAVEFLQRHQINFPNLIAEPMDVATMYQERTGDNWIGTPSFMVFNPRGELIGAQAGAVPVSIIESFIERESAASPAKTSSN